MSGFIHNLKDHELCRVYLILELRTEVGLIKIEGSVVALDDKIQIWIPYWYLEILAMTLKLSNLHMVTKFSPASL